MQGLEPIAERSDDDHPCLSSLKLSHIIGCVMKPLRGAFPRLVSYTRRVELMPSSLIPLCRYLHTRRGQVSTIRFIDSTPIIVCHPKRADSYKLFGEVAKWGKNSVGWFYGFKLPLIINDEGELLAVKLTPANVDDRVPVAQMTQALFGKLFGDKGTISQPLFELLFGRVVQLVTKLKKNMKNKLLPLMDKLLTRKRALIETVNDQLKNISQLKHTRHHQCSQFHGQPDCRARRLHLTGQKAFAQPPCKAVRSAANPGVSYAELTLILEYLCLTEGAVLGGDEITKTLTHSYARSTFVLMR